MNFSKKSLFGFKICRIKFLHTVYAIKRFRFSDSVKKRHFLPIDFGDNGPTGDANLSSGGGSMGGGGGTNLGGALSDGGGGALSVGGVGALRFMLDFDADVSSFFWSSFSSTWLVLSVVTTGVAGGLGALRFFLSSVVMPL